MRSTSQILSDYYAVVYLFDCVGKVSTIDGSLKIQKLLFLHEFEGIKSNLKSNHYKYFRLTYGPFSKDLANDVKRLEDSGLVSRGSHKVTKKGKVFLEYFKPEFKKAQGLILYYADEICHRFGKYTGPQLVTKVYKLSVPVYDFNGKNAVVKEIPLYTDIFDPLHDQSNKELPALDDETLKHMEEELSITEDQLDPSNSGFKKSVNEALERALA